MKRSTQVLVIGDSDPSPETYAAAVAVGALIAKLGAITVTGGLTGVMEAASKGAREGGGIVAGIVPGLELDSANAWTSVVIPTGIGHTRNVLNVHAADVVIAIGGGAGTLSEIAFAWLHRKPVLALTGFGGWADELAGRRLDERQQTPIEGCTTVEDLESALRRFLAEG
jgi:uncharacterized protein (TIGR00725 family)